MLLITHKLREILALADHVTVMRQGTVVLDCPVAQTSLDGLAQAMVGREVRLGRTGAGVDGGVDAGTAASSGAVPRPEAPVLLRARGLTWRDALGVARLSEVSLTLHAGEIVGVAGVSGNGQQELLAALSGEDLRAPATSIRLRGQPVAGLPPRRRRAEGLHFVPEERLGRGAVPTLTLAANTLLTRTETVSPQGWVRTSAVRGLAERIIQRFQVKAGGPQAPAKSLSGGNLQKVIVGREIDASPRCLVIAQPTWGVDVGAAALIRRELLALRDAGCAILVVSEELDELFEISDRLVVIARGRLSPALPVAEATVERIGSWMSGLWTAEVAGDAHAAA